MLFKHICVRHMEMSYDLPPADSAILQQKHQSYTGCQGFVRKDSISYIKTNNKVNYNSILQLNLSLKYIFWRNVITYGLLIRSSSLFTWNLGAFSNSDRSEGMAALLLSEDVCAFWNLCLNKRQSPNNYRTYWISQKPLPNWQEAITEKCTSVLEIVLTPALLFD